MISPETTYDSPRGDTSDPGAVYLETIALLQDEISRLESELQARREDELESGATPESDGDAAGAAALIGPRLALEIELSAIFQSDPAQVRELRFVSAAPRRVLPLDPLLDLTDPPRELFPFGPAG